MDGARSASLTLDLVLVVVLFVALAFASAYRPPTSTQHRYGHDVTTHEVGPSPAEHPPATAGTTTP